MIGASSSGTRLDHSMQANQQIRLRTVRTMIAVSFVHVTKPSKGNLIGSLRSSPVSLPRGGIVVDYRRDSNLVWLDCLGDRGAKQREVLPTLLSSRIVKHSVEAFPFYSFR